MWFLNSRLKFWDFYWFSFLRILKSSHFKSVMCDVPFTEKLLAPLKGDIDTFQIFVKWRTSLIISKEENQQNYLI
jgi:hypothetical protein